MSFAEIADSVTTVRMARPTPLAQMPLHHDLIRSMEDARRLQSIVVPLDGSEFAEHAIPLAIAIAKRSGGLVKLVHAFAPADSTIVYPGSGAFDIIDAKRRVQVRRYLNKVQRRIAAKTREITVVTHLFDAPNLVEALARVSKTADLVVMATHGRAWLGRFFFGSVARDLIRSRKGPIIFVRGYDGPADFSADPVPRNLTVALDGRKASERTLETAGVLAKVTGAKSTLLHIEDPDNADQRFLHSNPESYLHWTRRQLMKIMPDVSTRVVRNAPNPTFGILAFVDESEGDLIAVTTRGKPAFGSTAWNLIRKSSVPVLVVRE